MDVDTPLSTLSYPLIAGYRIGEQIGGGGFSRVFRAIDDAKGRVAACKVVNLDGQDGFAPSRKDLQKEVQVHKSLKSSNILEFLHYELLESGKTQYVPGLYMLLELAVGGDLFDKIAPDVGVPEDLAKFYFAQLHAAVAFIHSKGVAHRDLKPENLLLAANGNLKLSDFGLCAVYKYKGKKRLLSGRCGSLPYVAPELGGQGGYEAEPVDVWGMGIVLVTMLVGNTPWDEPSETTSPEYRAYLAGQLWEYEPWNKICGAARDLVKKLLAVDPSCRIHLDDIPSHTWCLTPSQLTREQLPEALTQGLRSTGMMAVADPTFKDASYAVHRSQRVFGDSQWGSQWNQQESQFMRGTGNLTQGGDYDATTTRFWLNLSPGDAYKVVLSYLATQLPEEGIAARGTYIRVSKAAGSRSVRGTLLFQESDTHAASGQTLVSMRREKGSILHWRAFWWTVVRAPQLECHIVRGDS
ncbi:Pkinase-domain-containing protein [Cutaneotrichosporon oleaginosum]|uniref:non-specific serine/threonine protein kinase n=1 Tax=Cutaneotrichosporon oleaginosum TaxID=879819 RepID=A0A0J0XC50_9TREE|nr:Pkinase-domain-containing protein [Cutaneotrichosporon oleaginosum]KLT38646.1 Pkinase-domain-containing protein [Cutaneotrichosporon oleaginosum]TXT12769.1 hypothetical protein COLE_03179 [Cutaneotrichosporon oleaginosum]